MNKKGKVIILLSGLFFVCLVALAILPLERLLFRNTTVYGQTSMIVQKEFRQEGSIWDEMRNHYSAGSEIITFVARDGSGQRYDVAGDQGGNYETVIPSGPYRVYVAWGKKDALFSQRWAFDVDIYGWSKYLDVGTDGQFDGGGMGRTNLKFSEEP